MVDDLNAKVSSDNTSLRHAMGKHGLGDCSDNGGKFVEFWSIHCLVIGGKELAIRSVGC